MNLKKNDAMCFKNSAGNRTVVWNDLINTITVFDDDFEVDIRLVGLPEGHLILPEILSTESCGLTFSGKVIFNCNGNPVGLHDPEDGIIIPCGLRTIWFPLPKDADIRVDCFSKE